MELYQLSFTVLQNRMSHNIVKVKGISSSHRFSALLDLFAYFCILIGSCVFFQPATLIARLRTGAVQPSTLQLR